MLIISGYEEQLKLCSTFTCSLSTPPWCACCLHAQIQYHHCIDKCKPYREARQEVCQELSTAKGCQHPTAKGSQHYPRIHLSVSSIHSRYRNLQKGLHSGNCLPQPPSSSTPYFHRKVSIVETACPKPPPLQPPSSSIPSFRHV